MTERDELIKFAEKKITFPIGVVAAIFLISFLLSPIVWVWYVWALAWKIGLTGIMGYLFFLAVYKLFKNVIPKTVDKELENYKNKLNQTK